MTLAAGFAMVALKRAIEAMMKVNVVRMVDDLMVLESWVIEKSCI